jgi:hypothetical protein
VHELYVCASVCVPCVLCIVAAIEVSNRVFDVTVALGALRAMRRRGHQLGFLELTVSTAPMVIILPSFSFPLNVFSSDRSHFRSIIIRSFPIQI